jgi:hypothetical protein
MAKKYLSSIRPNGIYEEPKLDNKDKAKVRREVDLDLGVNPPHSIAFTSKKIYSRKLKHKRNDR